VRSRAGAGPPSPSSRSPAARSASARWPAGPAHSTRPWPTTTAGSIPSAGPPRPAIPVSPVRARAARVAAP